MRAPEERAPSLELDIDALPSVASRAAAPAPAPRRAPQPQPQPQPQPARPSGPQARGGRVALQADVASRLSKVRPAAQAHRYEGGGFRRRSPGERALASARRASWIGLLILIVVGGITVRMLYPRIEVAARLNDLRSDALKVVELSGQSSVSAALLRVRAAVWAKTRKLDVVPNSLRVRIVRVPAPSTAGDAALALGRNDKVGTDHWYRVSFKLTTHLAKWGYSRPVAIRASRILALSASQNASPYKLDGQIIDDEPELDGAPARPDEGEAVREALPAKGRDLTPEGSVTGLGLSVGRFLADVTNLDGQVAALLGVSGLNVPMDELAWARARKGLDQVEVLQARTDRLRERAAGLREAVEVRYGLRLGKPWAGIGRALGLLKRTLGHLTSGSQASFVDGLDRYDLWHHAAMLKIQKELSSKGVFLGDAASGPDPFPKGSGPNAPAPEAPDKPAPDTGPGVKVKSGKGRRGR